jgi:hypothetical protein
MVGVPLVGRKIGNSIDLPVELSVRVMVSLLLIRLAIPFYYSVLDFVLKNKGHRV